MAAVENCVGQAEQTAAALGAQRQALGQQFEAHVATAAVVTPQPASVPSPQPQTKPQQPANSNPPAGKPQAQPPQGNPGQTQSAQPGTQASQQNPKPQNNTPLTPDQKADQLIAGAEIKECVVAGIWCSKGVDGRNIGGNLANTAKTDPAGTAAVFDKTMSKLPNAVDRQEVAQGFADGLSHDQIRDLAADPKTRPMVDRAASELRADASSDGKKTALARLETAGKAADLKNDPTFQKLDKASQQQALDIIKQHEKEPAVADHVTSLTKSGGFQSASATVRKEALTAFEHHAQDAVFAKGLENLVGDAAFKGLSASQQTNAVRTFDQFANRDVYKGHAPDFLIFGGHTVSDADKGKILDNLKQVVTSNGFNGMAPAGQNAMLGVLEKHATDSTATGNLVSLANSQGFTASSPAVQTELLTALDHRASDSIFAGGLQNLASSPAFAALSPSQQTDAIRAFDQFAGREIYQGSNGFLGSGIGGTQVSDADKRLILDTLGKAVTSPVFHNAAPDVRGAMLDALQPPSKTITPVTTGLGSTVDQLAAKSPSLQKDLAALRSDGWTIQYGPAGGGSFADRNAKTVTLDGNLQGNTNATVQALAHETGHVAYKSNPDLSSKAAFVRDMLADEGAATLENIKVQREIVANGGADIGVAGNPSNHGVYTSAYDQYVRDGNAGAARQTIGTQFGNHETTSTTGQPYAVYYGNWFAQHYPNRP